MCCLFGLLDPNYRFSGKQKTRMVNALAVASEARGTDATGISYVNRGKLRVFKRPYPAHLIHFSVYDDTRAVLGHTRMTTQGSEKHNFNNHPFLSSDGSFALAHNGIIYNDASLRKECGIKKTRIETDSYICVQLLEAKKELSFKSIGKMCELLHGTFTISILDSSNNLYIAKGDNPIAIKHFPESGLYLYASTPEILSAAIKRIPILHGVKSEDVRLYAGEILRIDSRGICTVEEFKYCGSYSYFGRPYVWDEPDMDSYKQEYIEDLKAVARAEGIDSGMIDRMVAYGLGLDEIEEYIYGGVLI